MKRMYEIILDFKNGVKYIKFIEVVIYVVKQNKMKVYFVIYLKRVKKYF